VFAFVAISLETLFKENSMSWRHELSMEQLDAAEGELIQQISRLSHEPLSTASRAELMEALDELFRLLPQRFDLKEAGGYLSDVVVELPEQRPHVEQLWIEQALLYEDLREIRERLRDVSDLAAAEDWVSGSLRDWLARLRQHEEQEARLSEEAAHAHG
jgi:hypothetical protein